MLIGCSAGEEETWAFTRANLVADAALRETASGLTAGMNLALEASAAWFHSSDQCPA